MTGPARPSPDRAAVDRDQGLHLARGGGEERLLRARDVGHGRSRSYSAQLQHVLARDPGQASGRQRGGRRDPVVHEEDIRGRRFAQGAPVFSTSASSAPAARASASAATLSARDTVLTPVSGFCSSRRNREITAVDTGGHGDSGNAITSTVGGPGPRARPAARGRS